MCDAVDTPSPCSIGYYGWRDAAKLNCVLIMVVSQCIKTSEPPLTRRLLPAAGVAAESCAGNRRRAAHGRRR